MCSSGGDFNNSRRGLNGGVSSSSSKSSSSSNCSSSSSPFSPSSTLPRNQRPKTMEEVWRDISLTSLHDQPSRDEPNLRGMNLQDFLARPFTSKDPQHQHQHQHQQSAAVSGGHYGSPPPPPAIALNLNSGPDQFQYLANSDSLIRPNPQPNISNVCPFNVPFDALPSPPTLPANEKKGFPDPNNNSGDRRYKRMLKNRESAARSRARKQAYTNELEIEIAHLMEENARLKKHQQQLCEAAAAELPKKRTLHRTSTAPF